jgi:superfamily II DNA or RNA helicase
LYKYPFVAESFHDFCLYQQGEKIFLPRLFHQNYPDGLQNLVSIVKPEPTFYKFVGKLRNEQVDIVNTVLNEYQKNGHVNGIIKARPALGKTVLTVYIAAKLGIKTCVIVDNDSLLRQWIVAFKDFTDLRENEIGIIKQKFFSTDTPVTIALVQTLLSKLKNDMSKNFEIIDKARFGLVVYDEVHNTSSAPKFAKVSLFFRTLNIIGLSATPFQTGVAEVLMKNTIGEIMYETKNYELKPTYVLNYYDSGLTHKYSGVLSRFQDYIKRKAFYNSIIIKSNVYFDLILDRVKLRLQEGHTVMILCFTKQQVKMISEKLESIGIENRRYYGDEKEDVDKDNVKVLVVTYSFAGKGFDFAQLSSLILATNLAGRKSLIQVIGRVLRKHDDKLAPVVDDLIDLAFPSMFIPDVKSKKQIVKNEFDCRIIDSKTGLDIIEGELK